MVRAIYAGSFDPMTHGHLDIINRASKLFDEVIMAVVANPGKSSLLSIEVRKMLIARAIEGMPGVRVEDFHGLLVDYARQTQSQVLVRGLRAITDFEGELAMAQTNKELFPELETIFLMSKAEYSFISSTMVKEIARLGGDVSRFVPPVVHQYLREHFSRGAE